MIITYIYTFECIRAGNKSITSYDLLVHVWMSDHLIYEQGHEHAYNRTYNTSKIIVNLIKSALNSHSRLKMSVDSDTKIFHLFMVQVTV
jgi:hypothetical protein